MGFHWFHMLRRIGAVECHCEWLFNTHINLSSMRTFGVFGIENWTSSIHPFRVPRFYFINLLIGSYYIPLCVKIHNTHTQTQSQYNLINPFDRIGGNQIHWVLCACVYLCEREQFHRREKGIINVRLLLKNQRDTMWLKLDTSGANAQIIQ